MVARLKSLALALVALVALPLHAQTFNLFKPANGILKGQTTTYVTTAAASSDVISLWSGTCNSSSFLRGDGSCIAPGGGGLGTVTSINGAGTGIFSFSGGPVTTSGTITLTQTGTSGGIPYFSNASTLSSSAVLPLGRLVLGGGAGAAPSTDTLLTWTSPTLSVGIPDVMTLHGAVVTSQIENNSDTQAIFESHTHSATAGVSASYYGARSRGTTASPAIVANNDSLLTLSAVGFDGVDYELAGYINFSVNGTPGSNNMPGAITFATTPSGSFTPSTRLTIGQNGVSTFTGEVITPASATSLAGFNVPHGTAPTSPVNGDMWTTTAGLFAQINGSTVGPFSSGSGTPGGSTTQVQYNSSGSFAGSAAFTWNDTTHALLLGNVATSPTIGTVVTATSGTPMTIYAGDCSGASCTASTMLIRAGEGTASSSTHGAAITVRGGNADTGNRSGGAASLIGGSGTGLNDAGNVFVTGGSAASGTSGSVTISTGATGSFKGNVILHAGTTDRITLTGANSASTGVQFNGYGAGPIVSDASGNLTVGASGTFTVNFNNACTTTPTMTFNYFVSGPVITISPISRTGFPCTADDTQFASSGADVPAALRPASTAVISLLIPSVFKDNGALTTGQIEIDNAGHMGIFNCATINTCGATTWTGSGSRDFVIVSDLFTYTYYKN